LRVSMYINEGRQIGRLEMVQFYFSRLFFESRNHLSVVEYLLRTERHFGVIESNHEIPAC
jgi:hypothetical protein